MADAATDDSDISTDSPMNKIYQDLHLFELSSTTDMVGHNKGIKKGGGSHITQCFCICCDENRCKCYMPRPEVCSKICEELHNNRDT